MSALPTGWAKVPLGQAVTLKTGPFGSALHKSDYVKGGVPLINPSHIRDGTLLPDEDVSVAPNVANRLAEYRLRPGEVVIGRRGEMGRCAVVPISSDGWLCGTGSAVVRSNGSVDPRYLQRFLSSPAAVAKLNGSSVGSTMVNLNQGVLLGLEIPVAPLSEQKRIVDKLDATLLRTAACRHRLERISPILKRFRQSVLSAAATGRLTEDWRAAQIYEHPAGINQPTASNLVDADTDFRENFVAEAEQNIKGWRSSTIGEVAQDIRYGTSKKCEYQNGDVAVLRIPNIGHFGKIEMSDLKFANFDSSELDKLRLCAGDILVIRSNGSNDLVGKCSVVNEDAAGNLFAGYLIRLRLDSSQVVPWFIYYCLSEPVQRRRIERISKSTSGVNNINSEELRSLPIRLPPLDEQHEIVRRVESLLSYAQHLEDRLTAAKAAAEQLTPALVAKAFRGELVSQNLNDEPAVELLTRLTASRVTTVKNPRRGKQVQKLGEDQLALK